MLLAERPIVLCVEILRAIRLTCSFLTSHGTGKMLHLLFGGCSRGRDRFLVVYHESCPSCNRIPKPFDLGL